LGDYLKNNVISGDFDAESGLNIIFTSS
jgi:hypothetical protein